MSFLKRTFLLLFIISIHVNAQKPISALKESPFYLVSQRAPGGNVYLDYLEERVQESPIEWKGYKCSAIQLSLFRERGTELRNYSRKESTTEKHIEHWKNDTLWHSIDCKKEVQQGIICGKKGKIKRTLIAQQDKNLPEVSQFQLDGDTNTFITYRPELNVVELESFDTQQRRYLLGNMYAAISKEKSGTLLGQHLNKNLGVGDQLQIVFTAERSSNKSTSLEETPIQVLEYTITQTTSEQGFPQAWYRSIMYQVSSGIKELQGDTIVSFLDEAVLIGSQTLVADTPFHHLFKIIPPDAPIGLHPFYPLQDIYGPSMEAFWKEQQSIGTTHLDYNCYWESMYSGRICWYPEFPLLWRDNGEGFRGKIVYVKTGDKILGSPYQASLSAKTGMREIGLLNNTLQLNVYSENAKSVLLEVKNDAGEVKFSKDLALTSGDTSFNFTMEAIFPGSFYTVVLSNKQSKEVIQQYRLVSRTNP